MSVRILLAEDNENLAALLGRFLGAQGHTVAYAPTGSEALRQLAAARVDLLVLDLRLPELSGIDLLQKIRKSPALQELPVIIITGVFKGERYAEAARRLGVRHYLEKPFSKEAFVAAIGETVAAIRAARPSQRLLDLLLSLYDRGASGLLQIGAGSPVAVMNGEPAGFLARGNSDFPDYLLARGKISRDEKQLFLESGADRLFFTEAGILSYDDLLSESQQFLGKRLMEDLPTSDGVSFTPVPVTATPLVTLSTPRLLYDASKFYPQHFNANGFVQQHGTRYPGRNRLFYRRSNLLVMRKEDIDLLAAMDGRTTLADLTASGPGSREAAGFFACLHMLGMIDLADQPGAEAVADFPQKTLFNAPLEEERVMEELTIGFDDVVDEVADDVLKAMGDTGMAAPLSEQEIGFEQAVLREYAQIKDRDYYAVFGMAPAKFSFNTLKEAYFAKMREYSPERFMELSGATSTMAQEILAIYAEAYNTLSNVVAKERYDEMLNDNKTMGIDGKQDGRLHARIQLQSGKVFLDMGEYENAEKALQEAYTLEPDNSEHAAFLAWAIYRNEANRNSKAAQERVRTLLTKSLQIDKSAEAFAFRGWLLLDEGRDGLAEGEFLKALKLNSKEPNARKGLKLIAEKREGDKKGLLKRFFG
jgi:CheY-like chemotaxis protein/tetratricopeptide (TPR) repeat protein